MTLSGGNKRKLSLAIALMGSPPVVEFSQIMVELSRIKPIYVSRVKLN